MTSLTLKAPAKLNLSLRIIGKREDGFHEIETLMVKLPGLADELHFQESSEFSFHCNDSTIPADESNLVVKALRSFQTATALPCPYKISLKKTIPHGAGLGGGSSDAACTLLGLNQLHGSPLSTSDLVKLASTLGSDIPFFLHPGAAVCTGRGEKIETVPSPSRLQVVLFKPLFNVATPDAYAKWQQSTELPGITYTDQRLSSLNFCNDLERPVFFKHRFLAELKQWLLHRNETSVALMSGSGSTVFAVLAEGALPSTLQTAAHHEIDPKLWSWSGFTQD